MLIGFRVQKVRDQCRDKHLHIAQCTCYVQVLNSVRVNYPMYTFSKNVQRSAADVDLASLGS